MFNKESGTKMAKDPRMTQKQIKRLLIKTHQEKTNGISVRNMTLRASEYDYDVLNAEMSIKTFVAFLHSVVAHYEENERIKELAEAQELDLRHAIALIDGLTDKERRMIYRRLSEALRARRKCKSENEVLQPMYDFINNKEFMNQLADIQGKISRAKQIVNNRVYGCRTSVLDDFRIDYKDNSVEPDSKQTN